MPRILLVPIAAVVAFGIHSIAASGPSPEETQTSVASLLERVHFSRKKIDDKVSRELLTTYLEWLDYNKMFFTQKDIAAFQSKYGEKLDDEISLGKIEAAHDIFKTYRQRVEDRIGFAKKLVADPAQFDFKSERSLRLNRTKAAWSADESAAQQLWRDRVENDLIVEKLAKEKDPVKRLTKRYDQILRNLHDQDAEDEITTYLNCLALTYDPHTEYMSKSQLESFNINMRLSLIGIGAVLQSEDGYAKISELIPGGPASVDGRLRPGDKICAVAQGDKDFEDTVDLKLDKVVEKIRGKKDTVVRLQYIPVTATDPSQRQEISIKRDEVKLVEQQAKAELIEQPHPNGSGTQRLGYINLPSFYQDMERSGKAGAKSTTNDVLTLVNRLKQEGIEGLVIDLRKNGGGSLDEAVKLTGLFINRGPVVQVRDSNGKTQILRDTDSSVAYDGPLIVLTNRLSASASEIFAAALQDYNRAVIVGDTSTFGKGTVQTMLELGRYMPFMGGSKDAGAIKLTIQKFYRVAGGSTQLKGVEPDIKLPSIFDNPEIGEISLKRPLEFDTIEPAPFSRLDKALHLDELRTRSVARTKGDPEFTYIQEDLERLKSRLTENVVSLNLDKRQAERDETKARKEKREEERKTRPQQDLRRYTITLENADKPALEPWKPEDDQKQKYKGGKSQPAPKDKDAGAITTIESTTPIEPKTEAKPETKPAPSQTENKPTTPEPPKATDSEDEDELEDEASPKVDAVRQEGYRVLNDLIELQKKANPPVAATSK